MLTRPTIHLDKPIADVAVLDGYPEPGTAVVSNPTSGAAPAESLAALDQMDISVRQIQQCCTALQQAVEQVNGAYEEMIGSHQKAIARLSVEIARKILAQTIRDEDYDIQAVIQEALKSAPETTDIVIRLHPNDLHMIRQLQSDGDVLFEGVKFTEDAAVGPCECVVETPGGSVPYRIEEHLEIIEKALAQTG